MIDALLSSAVEIVRTSGQGYDERNCQMMDDGSPPARCGDVFVAVHQLASRSTADNCLDERLGFALTLTMRCSNVPLDRVGDRLLAKKLAETTGFNARADFLRSLFHMNWPLLQKANDFLTARATLLGRPLVYGFCEPARYRGMETPTLQGGEWFGADPASQDVGLKAMLRFEDARRFQPIGMYV